MSFSIPSFVNVSKDSFELLLELGITGEYFLSIVVLLLHSIGLVVSDEWFKPIECWSREICGSKEDLVSFIRELFLIDLNVRVQLREE